MRIDQESPQDREALKEEIKGELRREGRRQKAVGCLVSFILLLLVVGAPIVYAASVVARTGLAEVPLLTRWQFHPSEPVRVVTPVVGASAESIVRAAVLKSRPDPQTGLAHIAISEQQLSAVAGAFVASSKSSLPIAVSKMQVAVEPGYVELFAVSPRAGREITVRLRLHPILDGIDLRLDLDELVIGSYAVPKRIAAALTSSVRRAVISEIQNMVVGAGEVVNITADRGTVDFVLRVNGH